VLIGKGTESEFTAALSHHQQRAVSSGEGASCEHWGFFTRTRLYCARHVLACETLLVVFNSRLLYRILRGGSFKIDGLVMPLAPRRAVINGASEPVVSEHYCPCFVPGTGRRASIATWYLCVCLLVYLENHMAELQQIFFAC